MPMEATGDSGECHTVSVTVKGMNGSLLFGPEILPTSTRVSEISEKMRIAQGIDTGCSLKLLCGTEELLADENLEKCAQDETLTLTSIVAKRPPPIGNYKVSENVSMREFSYDYYVHVTIEADGDGNGIVTWQEGVGGWRYDFDSFAASLKGTVTVGDRGALTFHLKGQHKHTKYSGPVEVSDKEVECTGTVDDKGLHLPLAFVATPGSGGRVLKPTEDKAVFEDLVAGASADEKKKDREGGDEGSNDRKAAEKAAEQKMAEEHDVQEFASGHMSSSHGAMTAQQLEKILNTPELLCTAVTAALEGFDSNKDGVLQPEEIVVLVNETCLNCGVREIDEAKVRQLFNKMDVNEDGVLKKDELTVFYRTLLEGIVKEVKRLNPW